MAALGHHNTVKYSGSDELEIKPTNTTQPTKQTNKQIYTLKENSYHKQMWSRTCDRLW